MARLDGIYRAVVTNNADPSGAGRVQARLPSAAGGVTAWALPCRPPTAAGAGRLHMAAKPAVGDTLWVMFEGGEAARPVWLGVL